MPRSVSTAAPARSRWAPAAGLNFEDLQQQDTFTVTVTATDPPGDTDTINVTITVTDVDEAPTITAGDDRRLITKRMPQPRLESNTRRRTPKTTIMSHERP